MGLLRFTVCINWTVWVCECVCGASTLYNGSPLPHEKFSRLWSGLGARREGRGDYRPSWERDGKKDGKRALAFTLQHLFAVCRRPSSRPPAFTTGTNGRTSECSRLLTSGLFLKQRGEERRSKERREECAGLKRDPANSVIVIFTQ